MTFNVSFSVVDIVLWAIQARLPDTCKDFHHKSNVAVVWQCVPSQVWARFRFFLFFLSGNVVFYNAASTKSYYVSHIQVWTLSDGQSSLWSRGASRASPTFSKKSVIHAVVNAFWFFSFSFFLSCFCLVCNACLLRSLVSLVTRSCCSLMPLNSLSITIQSLNRGNPPLNRPLINSDLAITYDPAFCIFLVLFSS